MLHAPLLLGSVYLALPMFFFGSFNQKPDSLD
jgi:hypothetical protein